MTNFLRTARNLLIGATLAATLLLSTATGWASDKITLKSGDTHEGTVIKEMEGYIWFKFTLGGIEQTKMFTPGEIATLDRDTPAAAVAAAGDAPAADTKKPASAGRPGVPRAAVITMGNGRDDKQGDMVGMYMTAYALDEMLPMLEQELGDDGTGVVVLRFSSGGGALLEIQRLSDVIHEKYKRKFRTVAWIDSAISAAAMTAICLEEIYFTPQGNFGACTGYSGRLNAIKDRGLVEVLYMMQKISARGGYDDKIMRSMQIQVPLSCTKLPNGKIDFYPDTTSGEILVNREKEILTFNAVSALEVGFSKGTAKDIDELTKLLGYSELDWVGEDVPGTLWPVSKAEKWNNSYRRQVKIDEDNFQNYVASFNLNIGAAQAEQDRQSRGRFVNRARQALDKIKNMIRNNPNFMLFNLGMETEEEYKEWLEKNEQLLRDLMR